LGSGLGPDCAISTDTRRVLAVIRFPVGGIRTYILYHYPTLHRAGFRFTFVSADEDGFHALRDEVRGWEGTEFIVAPLIRRRWRAWRMVRPLLRSGRFHVIHSHGLTAGCHSVLANLGVGVPHVLTSHDVFRKDQFPGFKGRVKRKVLEKLLGRVHTIVSVSPDAQDNLLEYLPGLAGAACRLTPVLNGIDTTRFTVQEQEPASTLRADLGIGADVFLAGFLGRFMEQKGFLPLLDALEVLKTKTATRPYHMVAVGQGDYQREYQAETVRRGLGDTVTFLPFAPDVVPLLGQLDLLVMPSLWEACGLLAMEALSLGVPLLASDCLGLRNVLEGSPAVTVPVADPSAFAAALGDAIAKPWRDAARDYAPTARQRFCADSAARKLGEILRAASANPQSAC
jgi:glycosyltransferase involved in cell wall biosynthesis